MLIQTNGLRAIEVDNNQRHSPPPEKYLKNGHLNTSLKKKKMHKQIERLKQPLY